MQSIVSRALTLLIAALASASPLVAQFVTPLPSTRSPATVATSRIQSQFERSLTPAQQKSIEAGTLTVPQITGLQTAFCTQRAATSEEKNDCLSAIDVAEIARRKSAAPITQAKTVLPFGLPGSHRRSDVEAYLREAGAEDGLSLFSRFAANVSDDEAYIVSDIISGLAGRGLFAINYAAVVVKDESVPEDEREAIESQRASIVRMINNGGTLAARYQLPVYAHSGPTFQSASSVYATGGVIGPLGNADSLKFAGGAVLETVMGISIRDISESATLLGDLLFAGRIGYGISEDELLAGTGDRGFPYAQLGVGLRQSGKVGLSALITWALEEDYKDFTPKLVVNFSAIR